MLQYSVIAFAIYVNDMDEGTKDVIAKFTDDIKIGRRAHKKGM